MIPKENLDNSDDRASGEQPRQRVCLSAQVRWKLTRPLVQPFEPRREDTELTGHDRVPQGEGEKVALLAQESVQEGPEDRYCQIDRQTDRKVHGNKIARRGPPKVIEVLRG
jgi:hypothetical protein